MSIAVDARERFARLCDDRRRIEGRTASPEARAARERIVAASQARSGAPASRRALTLALGAAFALAAAVALWLGTSGGGPPPYASAAGALRATAQAGER